MHNTHTHECYNTLRFVVALFLKGCNSLFSFIQPILSVFYLEINVYTYVQFHESHAVRKPFSVPLMTLYELRNHNSLED